MLADILDFRGGSWISSSTQANRFRVSDVMWWRIELLPPEHRNPHPERGGRPRRPDRDCFDAIFFVLRTGCKWNALSETGLCPSWMADDRSQVWEDDGFFERLWDAELQAHTLPAKNSCALGVC